MKIFFRYCLTPIFLLAFVHCKKPNAQEGEENLQIKLSHYSAILHQEEKLQLSLMTEDDKVLSKGVKWKSTDEKVAFITEQGEVNAVSVGKASVISEYRSYIDTCLVEVKELKASNPIKLDPLGESFDIKNIYSQNVPLIAPYRVMQSIDFDKKGNVFYSQIGVAAGFEQGKTKAHEVYIIRNKPNIPAGNDYMVLKYFGHGGNIAVDEDENGLFIWMGSNGTKYSSGEYWDEYSVSRMPFEAGKTYEGYGGESYFLNNGLYRIQAAVDRKGDLLCINASKDGERYFYTFKLSEAEALPVTDFDFSVKIGGEEDNVAEQVVQRKVQGRDLSLLEPLGSFKLPKGNNESLDVNSLSFQGYDIDESQHVYFFEGNHSGNLSQAYVTVFDIQGNVSYERTKVSAISEVDKLVDAGIVNNSGYMEAEGIKVKGNQLYLGFASYQGKEDFRRANIFKYDCLRD